jgi:RND family efflux transporter MFP subunit
MKINLILAAGITSLVSIVAGCSHETGAVAATANKSTPSSIERVLAGHPQRKNLVRSTTQPARIEAFEETPLFAKLAGYVDTVHVDIGDAVKAGQALVTLRIPELRDEVEQKKALVAKAEAEVKQAKATVSATKAAFDTATAKIVETKAGVARATANLARWSAEHERIKTLASNRSVTDKLVDETQSQLASAEATKEEAEATVQSAEASAREAQAMIAKADADRAAAVARLKVAQTDVARAETMLSYTIIAAPYNGVITRRTVDTGYFVQPASGSGAKPLLEVARTDKVRVYIDVPEMEAGLVDAGDMVTLRVQALPDAHLKAPVARTSWSLDAGNRALRAEVDFNNDGTKLRPGMFANAIIELDARANALALPVDAIVRSETATYCCRIESGKIIHQPIKLGLRAGSDIEIVDGINQDSIIVLARPQGLAQAQQVQVIQSQK